MVRRWRLIGYFPILYNPLTSPAEMQVDIDADILRNGEPEAGAYRNHVKDPFFGDDAHGEHDVPRSPRGSAARAAAASLPVLPGGLTLVAPAPRTVRFSRYRFPPTGDLKYRGVCAEG
jgi:hypothetical protein